MKNDDRSTKQVIATSTATYRSVQIMATATGFTFFWNGRQYDFQSLSEATAAIDAIYVAVSKVILNVNGS